MAATTTQTIHLIDCPVCKKHVVAELTYGVKLNERVRGVGEAVDLIDKTATATLTLTGVHIQHECPTPKPISFFTGGWQPSCHHPQPRDPRGLTMTSHRDAITGKYVTAEDAKTNPDTTVSESPCAECERLRGVVHAQRVAIEGANAKLDAVRAWVDRRGVNVDDRDDDYMRGYRDAQRHALLDAHDLRRALDGEADRG